MPSNDTTPVPASGRIHWVGTGLSTGSGLLALCQKADQVTVWGRTAGKAGECLDKVGAAGQARTAAFTVSALEAEIIPGDIVVSMLPAPMHPEILRLSFNRGAHFACSSYTAPEIDAMSPAAGAARTVILTEAGLDPGIDHALAHMLVARARASSADAPFTARFTSYCGGIPAVPNDFRYRFSWAPRSVLSALQAPARCRVDGRDVQVRWPWEMTETRIIAGEHFEVYPNRDSLPFLRQYDFPGSWDVRTFVRGTLRLAGWRAAWEPVFDVLRDGDEPRIAELADELQQLYPMTHEDADRVVLAVRLSACASDGTRYDGQYSLDLTGDSTETAMARTVSVSLATGVTQILDGLLPAGLHRGPDDPETAGRWLQSLRASGIELRYVDDIPEAITPPVAAIR